MFVGSRFELGLHKVKNRKDRKTIMHKDIITRIYNRKDRKHCAPWFKLVIRFVVFGQGRI